MSNSNQIITIENEFIQASISSYGAHLVSLIYKPLNRECVCGFFNEKELKTQSFYLGACVGRVANRIHKGQFSLNNKNYQLDINNGINHLHGGQYGFNQMFFDIKKINETSLIAHLIDKEHPDSYPGDIDFTLTFSCINESLNIEMHATSTKDTLFDPTLHTYFNLNQDKSETISNHALKLNAVGFYALDESGCTENHIHPLSELYKPNSFTLLKDILKMDHVQLNRAKGIDHFYRKQDENRESFVECCIDDLCLEVKTSHIGAHIYSGNYLESTENLSASFLQENGGICFETHHIPNSINFDIEHAPILKSSEEYSSYTTYVFTRRNA